MPIPVHRRNTVPMFEIYVPWQRDVSYTATAKMTRAQRDELGDASLRCQACGTASYKQASARYLKNIMDYNYKLLGLRCNELPLLLTSLKNVIDYVNYDATNSFPVTLSKYVLSNETTQI